jgi:zinc transport system substrate-binding protein
MVHLSTAVPGSQRGGEEAHIHSPHYWLSPRLMNTVADTIYANLISLLPQGRQQMERNLSAFKTELARVDSLISAELQPYRDREFWVFHPAYDYFADSYGLTQVALEQEGKEPGSRKLAELMGRAKADGVKVVYVQPQFSSGTARALAAEIGARLQPLDPLAYDYVENMLYISKQLVAGFSER